MIKLIKSKKIILITILILTFIATVSYAVYKTEIKVTYSSNTGEMICDIEIDTNESYKINGIPYFLVKVKNYKEENGNKTITATGMEYNLTIKNKDQSNGLFIWKKEDTNDFITTYINQITTNTYTFGKEEKEDTFQVFVKTASSLTPENVNVEVKVNAVQKSED